jgi:AcrR family transcriptional regulator
MKPSRSADDTRARILRAAHELFRHYGHAKTTVADVAGASGMSTANVYRFFASKTAINEAVCDLVVSELEDDLRRIATADLPAAQRLARLIDRIALFNARIHADERPIHEMLSAAVTEDWGSIRRHVAVAKALFAAVVDRGVEAGEFDAPDRAHMVRCLCFSLIGFWHPVAAIQCRALSDVPEAAELTDFLLWALRADRSVDAHPGTFEPPLAPPAGAVPS